MNWRQVAMILASDLSLALDPVLFARSLRLEPDEWQREVLREDSKRVLLNCCRQSGKSTTAAIKALHRALYVPSSLILLISPSLRQSGELFRTVSNLLDRIEQAPALFENNRLSLVMENGSRIVSLPSKEATVRGFAGVDLIIEDEAARVPDDLYRAIRPMLAVSGGQLILMSTPFGKRGHFHDEWENGRDHWRRVRIDAYRCPRISPEFLEEERRSLGEMWFRSEYLCQFTETVDSVFGYEVVMSAMSQDVKPLFGANDVLPWS
jgi:hypothetical protein